MKKRNYSDTVAYHVQREMTDKDKKYAAENLNETDENREKSIVEIRRWCEDELRIRIDDMLILRFLRVGKFNIEKTKTRIRKYYKLRSDLPSWLSNKDPLLPELQEILNIGTFLPLRKPDSQGRLILLERFTLHDPKVHKMDDIMKASVILSEVAMKHYAKASVYGYAIYCDVINPTIGHVAQLRPSTVMNGLHLYENCYPVRLQSIHMMNVSVIFDIAIRIIKAFLSKKMKNRFHVYTNSLPSCFKGIPASNLPIEYGGTDGTLEELKDYWKKVVEENRDWLLSDDNINIE